MGCASTTILTSQNKRTQKDSYSDPKEKIFSRSKSKSKQATEFVLFALSFTLILKVTCHALYNYWLKNQIQLSLFHTDCLFCECVLSFLLFVLLLSSLLVWYVRNMAQISKTETISARSQSWRGIWVKDKAFPLLDHLPSMSICWPSQGQHQHFSPPKYWLWGWYCWYYSATKHIFFQQTHFSQQNIIECTLKDSAMELKEITALISFQIEENQILLAYCIYTNDPILQGKQECLRVEHCLVNFYPSECVIIAWLFLIRGNLNTEYVEMRMNNCHISSVSGLLPLQNNSKNVVWQHKPRKPHRSPWLADLSAENEPSLVEL